MNENELYHYGVVGMKWGVRRAQKKGTNYTYKSHGTKKYIRKANTAYSKGDVEKGKRYKKYAKRSADLDRKMQINAEKTSAGKAIVKTLLTPTFGGRTYEAVKAATGNSKVLSRAAAYVTACMTGPMGATPVRALYVRGYDADRARSATKDIAERSMRTFYKTKQDALKNI